ncbi:hypothetical protein [Rathayibacter sp. VKM Ac-2857]|uniref:hypothetical protein n=1 Tax=Rathayibacter sp. VKM Ac-2857 TaxID=2739020 RepID=UPI001566C848|nr:hypothetical protein [Rathayibacter sp. VKM Ac-2857]NQX14367.1 hypothetical protein [Rathayibacter sp. VKM Ac-2857]
MTQLSWDDVVLRQQSTAEARAPSTGRPGDGEGNGRIPPGDVPLREPDLSGEAG